MTPSEIAKKTIVGFVEEILVIGPHGEQTILARIDSGAVKSSIDLRLASELKLGPIVESKMIKSANGAKLRPVIDVEIDLCGRKLIEHFTMADRSHMKYKALIGQNILVKDFLIDPQKKEGNK